MPKVLIVEDDSDSQAFLARILDGLNVDSLIVSSSEAALEILADQIPDLVLLDMQLPGKSGLQLFAEMQASKTLRNIPVLFISAEGQVSNKLAAFSLGAEDYIVKPFDPLELRARIESRLKKATSSSRQHLEICIEDLSIDPVSQRVTIKSGSGVETEVKLTSKEFKIVLFLAQNAEQVITRSRLIEKIWSGSADIYDRTVDTHICSIRKKLGSIGALLESVPGTGYRFSKGKAKKTKKAA